MKKYRYHLFAVLTFILIEMALYMAFLYAPTESTMGNVQRIFYFHVASAWVSFLAFFIVFISGIAFLKTGNIRWDRLASCSAELGVLFISIVLLTGPLWAKPVWNTYWSWDARLTTSFVLWLIYVAYIMVRNYANDRERGARFAAVFGIIGFVDVPIVYMSIRWWRTLHPSAVIAGGQGSGLAPEMVRTLMFSLLAFSVLFATLLAMYYRTQTLSEQVNALKHQS
jgi:heme exporter protein C